MATEVNGYQQLISGQPAAPGSSGRSGYLRYGGSTPHSGGRAVRCRVPLPYHYQETDYTCAAAAARIMLEALHLGKPSEAELAGVLRCDQSVGTPARHMARLSQSLEDRADYCMKTGSTLGDLRRLLSAGYVIIVLFMHPDEEIGHYGVVERISKYDIAISDPWNGPHSTILLRDFLWRSNFDGSEGFLFAAKRHS